MSPFNFVIEIYVFDKKIVYLRIAQKFGKQNKHHRNLVGPGFVRGHVFALFFTPKS